MATDSVVRRVESPNTNLITFENERKGYFEDDTRSAINSGLMNLIPSAPAWPLFQRKFHKGRCVGPRACSHKSWSPQTTTVDN